MATMIQANQGTMFTVDSAQRSDLPSQHSSNSRITDPSKYMRWLQCSILWGGAVVITFTLLYSIMKYAMLVSTPTSMHIRVSTCGFMMIVLDGLFLSYPLDSLSHIAPRICHILLLVVGIICMAVGVGMIYAQKSERHLDFFHAVTGITCITMSCLWTLSLVILSTKAMKKLVRLRAAEQCYISFAVVSVGVGVFSLFKAYSLEWITVQIPLVTFVFSINSLTSTCFYMTLILTVWLIAILLFYTYRRIKSANLKAQGVF